MTNNEPNVKPPLNDDVPAPTKIEPGNLFLWNWQGMQEYARAAIALNTPVCVTHAVAVQMARACAYAKKHTHSYLPQTVQEARAWEPHEWVIDAIRSVAHPAPTGVYAAGKVEKVARALAKHDGWDAWDTATTCSHTLSGNDPDDERGHYMELATAALAALAEGEKAR